MSTPQNIQPAGATTVTIRAIDSTRRLPWAEFWKHRELLYFLTWRDIKVRYKQTVLGAVWVILQPLAVALALALFLGRAIHLSSGNLPYPVFAYVGMVLWQFFSQALTDSSYSISNNEQLISKVYLPRLLIPLSSILASLLDFTIGLATLALFLVYFRIAPSITLVWLPFFVLPAVASSFGAGLWFAALNVKFHDIHHAIGFLVQFWFLLTPIAYPTSSIPTRWQLLYELNPMVGAVDSFRWALRGRGPFPAQEVGLAVLTATVLLATGVYYFHRTEDTFADFL